MPRIPYLDRDDVPAELRETYDAQLARSGYVLNLTRTLAHRPELWNHFWELTTYLLQRSVIDPALRELAILTVGWLAHSRYEFAHHAELGKRVGLTEQQIADLPRWASSPHFDERQRAVVRYAWQASERVHIADSVAEEVQEFLGHEEFLDLVATVAFYNMVVRMLEPLQIEPETAYQGVRIPT